MMIKLRMLFKFVTSKTFLIIVCILLMLFNFQTINSLVKEKKDKRRVEDNILALTDKINYFQLSNGDILAKVKSLNLKSNELKSINNDLYDELTKMNIKIKNLKSVSDVGITYKYKGDVIETNEKKFDDVDMSTLDSIKNVEKPPLSTTKIFEFLNYDNYNRISGKILVDTTFDINPKLIDVDFETKDSLIIAPEVKYKRLWYTFWLIKKPKSMDINVKANNPNTKIDYIKHYNFVDLRKSK